MSSLRTRRLRRNLRALYLLSALSTFGFSVPIFFLFQQEQGLTLTQAFLLQSVYSIVLVILEIPSGYVSDRWGRKSTIILGSLGLTLGMLVYALTGGFFGFLIAECLLALGLSLHSGTIEAMTYDTLSELKNEDAYLKVNGLQGFFSLGSKALTSLLVGSLAVRSLRLPFWADVILFGSALLLSLTLVEPVRKRLTEKRHFRAMGRICLHALVTNPILRGLLLISMIVAAIDVLLFWFIQPYQIQVELPTAAFGVLNAALCLLGALAYKEAHRFKAAAERPSVLYGLAALIAGSALALAAVDALWGLSFFLFGGILYGLFDPLSSNAINHATTSDVRATVLSLKSLGSRILFALAAPFLGAIADTSSLSSALLLTGLLGFAALGIALLISLRSPATFSRESEA